MPSEQNYILESNEYMNSDKIPCIIYADIGYLIKEIDGYANNKTNLQQQKQVRIFLVDIQCQQFGHFIIYKASILYITEKIVSKGFVNL